MRQPYRIHLNGKYYGEFATWEREDTKRLLRTRDNHVQVYNFGHLIIDICTSDLRNLPNY